MLRALFHYFLIGGLLFGAKAVYDRGHVEGPTLTVHVAADASPATVERAVREAVLLNEARRQGWDRKDPVVYTHLVRNMRFIEPDATDSDPELYLRALQMNMHRHDPIVRARLLYRANEAIGHVPQEEMPDRDELRRYLEEHHSEFERPGNARFWHVFLSGTKRGDRLSEDASAMRATLDGAADERPKGLGDPLPGLSTEQTATSDEVRIEYGPAFADALADAIVGVWRGPIPSVYGVHFINVREVAPSYVPALDDIAPEVREHYLRGMREELRARRMEELVESYTIEVERLP